MEIFTIFGESPANYEVSGLVIQMLLGPDDCPVVSASGQVRGARCGKQLSGVCVAKHCAGRAAAGGGAAAR